MLDFSDRRILESWKQNSLPWIEAVENHHIESRRLVTNQAIIDSILSLDVNNFIDVGCGEGWLVRRMADYGISAMGIDATAELICRANEQGVGSYKLLRYEDISPHTLTDKYDLAVCNFSLIGKESVNYLFKQLPFILNKEGFLIIQTLHPLQSGEGMLYQDGWREGSWKGFNAKFINPAPWYFRTLKSWKKLFIESGLSFKVLNEPEHPESGMKLSIIMCGRLIFE